MWDLCARVERLYQLQRRNPTPSNVSKLSRTQSRYRKECWRQRHRLWLKHMGWTPGPQAASKLMRVFQRKETQNISTFLNPDGISTLPGEDTADLLFLTHFPQSTPAHLLLYEHTHAPTALIIEHFTDIFSLDTVRDSMVNFQSLKTPGLDGFKPVLLLYLPPNVIHLLCVIYVLLMPIPQLYAPPMEGMHCDIYPRTREGYILPPLLLPSHITLQLPP